MNLASTLSNTPCTSEQYMLKFQLEFQLRTLRVRSVSLRFLSSVEQLRNPPTSGWAPRNCSICSYAIGLSAQLRCLLFRITRTSWLYPKINSIKISIQRLNCELRTFWKHLEIFSNGLFLSLSRTARTNLETRGD